jgi:chromosome partitioning protein
MMGRGVSDRGKAEAPLDDVILRDAEALSRELARLRARLFPPTSSKEMRRFTSGEAARLLGVSDSYLRQLSLAGEGPEPETGAGGRRLYTLAQINALRRFLSERVRGDQQGYLPTRQAKDRLQVIAVTNFKGGSGKTTTTAHLAQYLALQGYRVLALDLDPQASLSALFGYMPELDLKPNASAYAALRYDDQRVGLASVVRETYVDGLSIVPAQLELQEFEHMTAKASERGGEGARFYLRLAEALGDVEDRFDVVVIDCPPQLGFLTLAALTASTGVIVTVHPQMLDVASMSQFLFMASDLLAVIRDALPKGAPAPTYDFLRYLVTRHEPNDGPQTQIVGFLRSLFGERVLTSAMVKSTAVSDAGLSKQTLYEVGREQFNRNTYDRAIEALDAVNGEIEALIRAAWGRAAR